MGKTRTVQRAILILFALSLLIAACAGKECDQEAFVDSVEIKVRGGEYYAVVRGHYPDVCSKPGAITQEVEGNTIKVTVCAIRPDDVLCAQVLAPFEEEIKLDAGDLSPGQYTLDVNGTVTTLTIP